MSPTGQDPAVDAAAAAPEGGDGTGTGSAGTGAAVLRVLTWNVHGLRAGTDAVAAVLRSARCDVALLQEGPRGPRTVPRAADLARRSGLLVAAAGRPAAGDVVLVAARVAPTDVVVRPLPVRGWRTPVRGLAAARLALPDGRAVVVAAGHLGLTATERADHVERVRQVLDHLARPGEPVVVGADLNEHPGGPSWAWLLPGAVDAWAAREGRGTTAQAVGSTFPERAPRHRIDAVLVRGARVGRVEVLGCDGASDHRPVVAEVLLPPS